MDTLRIKRRAAGGAAGAPSSLAAAEIAYNEVDNTLYYGKGNSSGSATSIIPLAGSGFQSFQSESQVLIGAMTTPPTLQRQQLIDQTIIALKNAGLWAKLDVLWILAAADSQAARLNWKSPTTFTLAVTNSPIFTVDRGYAGDAVSAKLSSTYAPSTFLGAYTLNAATFGLYVLTAGTSTGNPMEMYLNNNGRIHRVAGGTAANGINYSFYMANDATNTNVFNINPSGHLTVQRTTSTSKALWQNGIWVDSHSLTATTLPNAGVAFFGISPYSDSQFSYAYAGALADADIPVLDSILATYLQGVGALAPAPPTIASLQAQISTLQVAVANLIQWANTQTNLSYQPESLALFAAMTTTPTYARKQAIDFVISSLKLAGIWSQLDFLFMFAAADSQAARLNWIYPNNPRTLCTPVNAPVFTADRGYTGDGSSSYLTAGYDPAAFPNPDYTLNSAMFGVYIRTCGVVTASNPGELAGTLQTLMIYRQAGNAQIVQRVNDVTSLVSPTYVAGSMTGHWAARRESASSKSLWRDGASVATSSAASSTVSDAPCTFLAQQSVGFSDSQLSFGYGGNALSDANMLTLHNILYAYLRASGAVASFTGTTMGVGINSNRIVPRNRT